MRKLVPHFVLAVVIAGLAAIGQAQPVSPAETAEGKKPVAQFTVNGEPKQLYLMVPNADGSGARLAKVTGVSQMNNSDVNLSVEPAEEEKLGSSSNLQVLAAKATMVAAAVSASPFARVLVNYSGTKEVSCPQDHPVLVFASCDYTGLPIMWDQNSLLPPGSAPSTHWTHWLIPNAQTATGVHCAQPSGLFSSQARLLCTSLH